MMKCRPAGLHAWRTLCIKSKRPVGPRIIMAVSELADFLAQYWESNAFGLPLILAYNYNLTTNNFTTRHGAHRGRTETF